MDIAMRGMTGIEALRHLKADPRTASALLIVVTGSGMKRFEEARAAGCDAFFGKPFDPAAIQHILPAVAPAESPPTAPLPRDVVKRCSCGRQFSAQQWFALPRCGRMHLTQRDAVVEVRNCPCGSSMALQLTDAADVLDGPSGEEADGRANVPLQSVFVVDRDVHVRRLLLHFVGSAYLLEFFEDGYTALDRVRRSRPAAVVSEIMVPRLDGVALCRLLKGDSATAKVPILLFSVLDASERALQAGADAFLAKPLVKDPFVATLLRLVEPRRSDATTAREKGAP